MKLRDKIKPSIPPLEPGVYQAVCVTVADIGDQYSEKFKKVSRQVLFTFEIPSETVEVDGEEKPRQLSTWCTFTIGKNSRLKKLLNSWLNANFSDRELVELEMFSLLGRGCQVRVISSEDGAYSNIEDVMALPKGTATPVTDSALIAYDIDMDGFAGEKWDALPEWLRSKVEKSEQYADARPDKPLEMPPEDEEGECPI